MTRSSIREYVEAVRGRYFRALKKAKGKILDEFTKVTGCHQKAAIRLIRRGNHTTTTKKRGRSSHARGTTELNPPQLVQLYQLVTHAFS